MKESHTDRLGRELAIGDCVAVPVGNHLRIGRVSKLTPKMVRVKELNNLKYQPEWIKYSRDLVVVEGSGVTMLVLKAGQ